MTHKLAATALLAALGCRNGEPPRRHAGIPFEKATVVRILSSRAGDSQRFLLKTTGGPVTAASLAGLQRGSDLRLEMVTPVELTLEPGTVDITATAIGDSGVELRAILPNGSAQGAVIEVSSNTHMGRCCALPRSFRLR